MTGLIVDMTGFILTQTVFALNINGVFPNVTGFNKEKIYSYFNI